MRNSDDEIHGDINKEAGDELAMRRSWSSLYGG
jgi:hypothetical protein